MLRLLHAKHERDGAVARQIRRRPGRRLLDQRVPRRSGLDFSVNDAKGGDELRTLLFGRWLPKGGHRRLGIARLRHVSSHGQPNPVPQRPFDKLERVGHLLACLQYCDLFDGRVVVLDTSRRVASTDRDRALTVIPEVAVHLHSARHEHVEAQHEGARRRRPVSGPPPRATPCVDHGLPSVAHGVLAEGVVGYDESQGRALRRRPIPRGRSDVRAHGMHRELLRILLQQDLPSKPFPGVPPRVLLRLPHRRLGESQVIVDAQRRLELPQRQPLVAAELRRLPGGAIHVEDDYRTPPAMLGEEHCAIQIAGEHPPPVALRFGYDGFVVREHLEARERRTRSAIRVAEKAIPLAWRIDIDVDEVAVAPDPRLAQGDISYRHPVAIGQVDPLRPLALVQVDANPPKALRSLRIGALAVSAGLRIHAGEEHGDLRDGRPVALLRIEQIDGLLASVATEVQVQVDKRRFGVRDDGRVSTTRPGRHRELRDRRAVGRVPAHTKVHRRRPAPTLIQVQLYALISRWRSHIHIPFLAPSHRANRGDRIVPHVGHVEQEIVHELALRLLLATGVASQQRRVRASKEGLELATTKRKAKILQQIVAELVDVLLRPILKLHGHQLSQTLRVGHRTRAEGEAREELAQLGIQKRLLRHVYGKIRFLAQHQVAQRTRGIKDLQQRILVAHVCEVSAHVDKSHARRVSNGVIIDRRADKRAKPAPSAEILSRKVRSGADAARLPSPREPRAVQLLAVARDGGPEDVTRQRSLR
mmetsp:Transcript_10099/g.38259  ORF Transcript_10099/g.38259 Transcript_10099/m.38259 type:complete len:759 (+) Transcript_10099:1818-4094(+)